MRDHPCFRPNEGLRASPPPLSLGRHVTLNPEMASTMPHGSVTVDAPAPRAAVFSCSTTMTGGWSGTRCCGTPACARAGPRRSSTATTVCTGRWFLGGLVLKTEYILFKPPAGRSGEDAQSPGVLQDVCCHPPASRHGRRRLVRGVTFGKRLRVTLFPRPASGRYQRAQAKARQHRAHEKLKILEEARQPGTTIAEILRRHRLDVTTFYRCERQGKDALREAFSGGPRRPSARRSRVSAHAG